MSENRCRRCNRKLIDPDAVYGWRCAKKLGVSTHMATADGLMWQYFYDGIAIGDIIISGEGVILNAKETEKFYEVIIKWAMAYGANDEELKTLFYNDRISLAKFMQIYKMTSTQDANLSMRHITKTDLYRLQAHLNRLGYRNIVGEKLDFTNEVERYLNYGYIDLPDGMVIDAYNYNIMNGYLNAKDAADNYTKNEIINSLNQIVDKQYNKWSKGDKWTDIPQNIKGRLADIRLITSLEAIDDNVDTIKKAAYKYNIPYEIIGSVIFKEQYTQSIPDGIIGYGTVIDNAYPNLKNKISFIPYSNKILKDHSVGLGAVFSDTARIAWEYCIGKDNADKYLPKDDFVLMTALKNNDEFNIETIAVVLKYKAHLCGYDDLSSLSYNDWQKVCAMYNGSGEMAERYGKYIREYFPYIKNYLAA